VAELVSGVTKLQTSSDHETLKKVIDKTYINPGVAILKLADRLHNMRTLEFMKPEKQIEKSKETLDIYTRLAESLGMWNVKTELEDLCFKYLDFDNWQKTSADLENDPRLSPDFSYYLKSRIEQILDDSGIAGQVETRKSGCWILKDKQEKMALKGKGNPDNFKDINDLISFRVQLNTKDDCRIVLGRIEDDFGEMIDQERYDNFILKKRVNGYQALQTTVDFPQGPVEIALMTKEMEEFNNWGVVNVIKNNGDLKDYVLKLIFTPTGSVRFLPKNAVGADFAATINPQLLADAKTICVDGVEKPLSVIIPNASVVRVNIGESRRAPLEGIEDYVALPQTRRLIKEQRILEKKDILIKQGKEMLESVLIPRGLLVLTDQDNSINPILFKFGCQGINDLYFMVGNGSIKNELISKELDMANITKEKLKLTSIRLKGIDQPRILVDVASKISDINKNIVNVFQEHDKKDEFNIRIVVKEMTKDEEDMIREFLEDDSRFREKLVV
jgi:(p)ppGpp synthase/HD superfamily hydrolase